MDQFVLKEKIRESIGEFSVKAALVNTFNFYPRFFENYVMPLFVKGNDFGDHEIQNKILWRKYQQNGAIPPVTVYCDYFVKDRTAAPALGYEIFCVKMPAKKGKICNFHPKHTMLLLEDENGLQKLLLITGSGNITPAGWCDNFEAFSVELIAKSNIYPRKVAKNVLQEVIDRTVAIAGNNNRTEAEELINNFLRYTDVGLNYYHSSITGFKDFLNKNIFKNDIVYEVEIISPYFSKDLNLVDFFNSHGIKKVKCLVPSLRSNQVDLEKEVFDLYKEGGVLWSAWESNERKKEVRNIHSKIYRLYGKKKIYTIIGSVNFTEPGWAQYTFLNNEANCESAVLYVNEQEGELGRMLQVLNKTEIERLDFVPIDSDENIDDSDINRNPPNLTFILDWKSQTLQYIFNPPLKVSKFKNILSEENILMGNHKKQLSDFDIKALTSNTLIAVTVTANSGSEEYVYYPTQINIENKPLDFKLSVLNVLDYWDFLGDDYQSHKLSKALAERITDDSGIVHESLAERNSVLNETAAYFNSLIKLERYLFKTVANKSEKSTQFQNLRYYLLTENVDTVKFCLKGLEQGILDKKLSSNLFWMVLQILINNFYDKAFHWKYLDVLEADQISTFKDDIQSELKRLKASADQLLPSIEGLKDKQFWVIKQLRKNYD